MDEESAGQLTAVRINVQGEDDFGLGGLGGDGPPIGLTGGGIASDFTYIGADGTFRGWTLASA